ncbi:rod shape-determining protein RodA [Eikenella sp. S3360]|uniref:Rod shape-determining protein RodA n=1 Tax=Eikenella glucosivorans TaxID=2766967 RepID=A0ABS0NDC1_9NEIS|nr:Mth938-like domain-containing protein [Eikenella glucosivorans]MBH5330249.1 rod shape-determining protein RodA [Eikenella glucosivorans]
MLIQEHHPTHSCRIEHYQPGELHINGQVYHQAVLLDGSGSVQPVSLASSAQLQTADLARAAQSQPEVILIGTGERQQFIHPRIAAAATGIGVECMHTAAAVRTYLLLQSEGRRVWAWLWV